MLEDLNDEEQCRLLLRIYVFTITDDNKMLLATCSTDCSLSVHRQCVRVVEENCPGPLEKERRKERGNDRISKLMERIRPERKPPSSHHHHHSHNHILHRKTYFKYFV